MTHPETASAPRRRRARTAAPLAALLIGLLGAAAAPAAAVAAPADVGWLRVTHLSPDTAEVDVYVSPAGGGEALANLTGVGYGVISDYFETGPGTYLLQMRPAGADPASPAVISGTVEVDAGEAVTVAAYGLNSDLRVGVYSDDLRAPAAGQARVRLIQASTQADEVSVSTGDGDTIAEDAAFGSATSYAALDAGDYTFEASGGDAEGSSEVEVAAGTVTTLLVLDDTDGGLVVTPVVDSVATAQAPNGGVQTGGGYLAGQREQHDDPWTMLLRALGLLR